MASARNASDVDASQLPPFPVKQCRNSDPRDCPMTRYPGASKVLVNQKCRLVRDNGTFNFDAVDIDDGNYREDASSVCDQQLRGDR